MKNLFFLVLASVAFFPSAGESAQFRPERAPTAARGNWIASGGLGLTFGPTLVLLTPQLEYVHDARLTYGPMIQAGLGDATLVTFSGTVRYQIGDHPKLKPNVEGGLGLAVGSSFLSSSVGVHILIGMGADFIIDNTLSVGTSLRINFAPPLDTFFMSWPIGVVRFKL